jgi:hypothetical protein
MATSAQIRGYAKQHNCSNAEAKAHFVKQAVEDFILTGPQSADGFKPDAGISMKTNKSPGVVINVSQFVAGALETEKKFGGSMYPQWKDGIEITDTMCVIGDKDYTEFCGTLWFTNDMLTAFCNEIGKGAQNIEILGTPQSITESNMPGDAFRPIEVDTVKVRGVYSNAGGDFTTHSYSVGSITHGEFAKKMLMGINNQLKAAS